VRRSSLSRSAERGAPAELPPRRGRRMGAPHLVPAVLAVVAGVLLWRFGAALLDPALSTAAASPETQVKQALAEQARATLDDVYGFRAGGTVELAPVRFADVTVEADRGRARVLAVVEARGTVAWRAGRAELTYVGREAFGMARCRSVRWCADGEQFAQLRGVLTALFRRADAAAARDADALGRVVSLAYAGPGGRGALLVRRAAGDGWPGGEARVRTWQIRVERDRASVGEDFDLVDSGGGSERRRALYALAREDGRWVFVDGL
jgi:hypothetical protein